MIALPLMPLHRRLEQLQRLLTPFNRPLMHLNRSLTLFPSPIMSSRRPLTSPCRHLTFLCHPLATFLQL